MSLGRVDLHWPELPASVVALSTTRIGGVSGAPYDDGHGAGGLNLGTHVGDVPEAVAQNRSLLRALLPTDPAWLTQVHGTRVLDASIVRDAPEADATIATRPGAVCAIMTADCMPVLLTDARGSVVGAAHAGWRGLAAGVLEPTVAAMREAGATEILAWLGPSIGPQAFEVGPEVREAFSHLGPASGAAFKPIPASPGKFLADLPALARMVLGRVGVSKVTGGMDCTYSDANRFYSYRRDRVTGRMVSLIWIK